MRIKNINMLEAKLDEEYGEIIAKVLVSIEVEDESHTSYLTELQLASPPVLSWERLDVSEKDKHIRHSLKGKSY